MPQVSNSVYQNVQHVPFPLLSGTHGRLIDASRRSTSQDAQSTAKGSLALYIAGWSEVDQAKIADATSEGYEFHDPLVGRFSKRTLPQYFALLRSRFAAAGLVRTGDLAFTLRGPMQSVPGEYWREAPFLGLSGVARITVTPQGVAAETVAYDLNMACETLRGCTSDGHPRSLTQSL